VASSTWIRGRVVERMRAGTSTVYAVHALETGALDHDAAEVAPLVYHNRTWHRLNENSRLTP
jgi:flavin reductase (DIM6/NTAB) family NADH-FMN oxidoreductase RutF